MSEQTPRPPTEPAGADQDTEGHNLWIDPRMSRDLATSRSKDLEREARERQRARESRKR
jgi:hypothetical protein